MRSLERIKDLVGRRVRVTVPSVKDVNSIIEKTEGVIQNAKRIKKVLEKLKEAGVKSILNVDYKNKKVKIYGRHFLLLAQEGYEASIKRGKRNIKASLEIDSVKVVGNLDRELTKELVRELKKFEFWNSDYKAKNLKEFRKGLKKVPIESIEHHYSQGDFRRWLGRVMRRGDLVKKIDDLDEELRGEELRKALLSFCEIS